MIAPVLNDIADSESDVTEAKVKQQLAAKFEILGIPTMVIFRNGSAVKRFSE